MIGKRVPVANFCNDMRYPRSIEVELIDTIKLEIEMYDYYVGLVDDGELVICAESRHNHGFFLSTFNYPDTFPVET